jgi:hypothetical protein
MKCEYCVKWYEPRKKGSPDPCKDCPIIKGTKERGVYKMKKNKVNKSHLKKEGEELQLYLHFRKRGSVVENKKGKGSYNRQKAKRERGGEE